MTLCCLATRDRRCVVSLFVILFVDAAMISGIAVCQNSTKTSQPSAEAITLQQIARGDAKLIDLTHALNEKSPFWPGENYQPFRLSTIATLEKDGVLSKSFAMPEHFGTHLDAPNHFEAGQAALDKIPPRDLFAPGVVVDISMQTEMDHDYRLTQTDLAAWENEHGRIPKRAIVLLRTGWGRHWTNPTRYRNQDATGRMHFPGYSADAAEFLIRERQILALGIDTLSIDHGVSKNFIVHHRLNRAGRYGLENVANLEQLPVHDFFLIVAPIKIESGSGGPTRLFAVLPESTPAIDRPKAQHR